jgi:hypothetical protein
MEAGVAFRDLAPRFHQRRDFGFDASWRLAMSDEQQDMLKNELSALRREVREMRNDLERLKKAPFAGTGWRAWPALGLLALMPVVLSYTVAGMFWGYSSLSAGRLEARNLTVQTVYFEDRSEAHLGSISTIGAKFDLRDRGRDSSVSLSPTGLRIKDEEAICRFEPYSTLDGLEGVRIHVRSVNDPSRAASIFLALPDGQGESKPALMLLDAHSKPVE